jgi:hypothetical protein
MRAASWTVLGGKEERGENERGKEGEEKKEGKQTATERRGSPAGTHGRKPQGR